MSFHTSASNIRVDDGHILRARLRNTNGDEVDAELDLNSCIGNNEGRFQWGGRGTSFIDPFRLTISLGGLNHVIVHSQVSLTTLPPVLDFASSAENIYFSLEGDYQVPVLRARLSGSNGPLDADVNLAECISNQNGSLSFCESTRTQKPPSVVQMTY